MTTDRTDEGWDSEFYRHVEDLTDAEKDAIHILCGVHPDAYLKADEDEDEDEDEDTFFNPHDIELMYFLINATQFARTSAFGEYREERLADLLTFADYLEDTAHLMAKVERPGMPALIIASLAATIRFDARHASDPQAEFERAWATVNEQARDLLLACLPTGPKR